MQIQRYIPNNALLSLTLARSLSCISHAQLRTSHLISPKTRWKRRTSSTSSTTCVHLKPIRNLRRLSSCGSVQTIAHHWPGDWRSHKAKCGMLTGSYLPVAIFLQRNGNPWHKHFTPTTTVMRRGMWGRHTNPLLHWRSRRMWWNTCNFSGRIWTMKLYLHGYAWRRWPPRS